MNDVDVDVDPREGRLPQWAQNKLAALPPRPLILANNELDARRLARWLSLTPYGWTSILHERTLHGLSHDHLVVVADDWWFFRAWEHASRIGDMLERHEALGGLMLGVPPAYSSEHGIYGEHEWRAAVERTVRNHPKRIEIMKVLLAWNRNCQ